MSVGPDRAAPVLVGGLSVRCDGPDHAPAVIFSAGLGGLGSYWAAQALHLAADRRTVLYDHRGTGRSDRAPLPTPYSLAHMADDILTVLDGLDISSAHVVGHAAGGIAGLVLAATAPERVNSLTIVNGWARPSSYFGRCMSVRREAFDHGGAEAYLRLQPMFLYPAAWISEHLEALDEEAALSAASFQSRDALFARMNALEAFDASAQAAEVVAPTMLVAADDDMLVPAACSRNLAQLIPGSRLEPVDRGGHAINITDPSRFNRLLRGFIDHVDQHSRGD